MALTTHHDTSTIQHLVQLCAKKHLNLAPAFQRQSVWQPRARQLLIQSLLDGVPIPSIFLYRRVGQGGVPVYDVIDGKQRIETILLFLGKGPLAKDHDTLCVKRSASESEPLDWWSWWDLDKATRNRFLTVKLPTIEVEGELGEIIDLFVRINSTGSSLTGQERRHARYYTSPVLRLAQRLANELTPFLLRNRVLAPAQIQRMKNVELVTELLLGIHAGVHLNKKTKIDDIIRGDGLNTADLKDAETELRRSLAVVGSMLPDLKTTRFRQLADFYSLVLLVHRYRDEGRTINAKASARNSLGGALLREFGRGVDEVTEQVRAMKGTTALQEPFRAYLMTVREGTDSAGQRRTREKLLREVLDGVFEDRDANRVFNPVQRRILWHASAKKRCSICKRPIERWEDLSIDHIEAHVHGGKTDLANGAIAHKNCNSAKGAKQATKRAR